MSGQQDVHSVTMDTMEIHVGIVVLQTVRIDVPNLLAYATNVMQDSMLRFVN